MYVQDKQQNNNKNVSATYKGAFDTISFDASDFRQPSLQQVKSRQMMSNLMDTIQQKSNNPIDLKRSLSNFDKQFLNLYNKESNSNNQKCDFSQTIQIRKQNYHPPNRELGYNDSKSTVYRGSSLNNRRNQRIPQVSYHKLQLPKPNTLTDQFMKLTLGPQQELIEQYDRTVNPQKYKQQDIQEMKLKARNYFTQNQNKSNAFNQGYKFNQDRNANPDKPQAFFDDQYFSFLKTNMKYMTEVNRPNNILKKQIPSRNNQLLDAFKDRIKNQFYPQDNWNKRQRQMQILNENNCLVTSSHRQSRVSSNTISPERIVKKIKQTGGIQNTIQKMQKSLKKNQINHLKINQYLGRKQSIVQEMLNKKTFTYRNNSQRQKLRIQRPDQNPQKSSFSHRNSEVEKNNQFMKSQGQNKNLNLNWREKSESSRKKIQKMLEK